MMKTNIIIQGDALEKLKEIPDNSIDSIVTDPPSSIGFMGMSWDDDKGGRDQWIRWLSSIMTEALRTLKPGGHALVWALPRVSHWTGMALEDAGFEIRDIVHHLFGSGFPKSLNIGKSVEALLTTGKANKNTFHKLEGERREGKVGLDTWASNGGFREEGYCEQKGAFDLEPTTEEGKKWNGWGSSLKPAAEHWILCRKPLSEKTLAENVLKWETGGLNIDECRVKGPGAQKWSIPKGGIFNKSEDNDATMEQNPKGRFPANVTHDGSDVIVNEFPEAGNGWKRNYGEEDYKGEQYKGGTFGGGGYMGDSTYCDSGSAARFFYSPKASKSEKNQYMENLKNTHPTVKNLSLMLYLIKLITPKGGIVLDCFAGSGTTLVAADQLNHPYIGIELDTEYCRIAEKRLVIGEFENPFFG